LAKRPSSLSGSFIRKILRYCSVNALAASVMACPKGSRQGCQIVCFQTKNPNLGKFWMFLQWKILVKLLTIWYILRPFEICYGHLVYFVVIWYIFPRFGILYQKIWQPRSSRHVLIYRDHDTSISPSSA
jgi:hypothetical protein